MSRRAECQDWDSSSCSQSERQQLLGAWLQGSDMTAAVAAAGCPRQLRSLLPLRCSAAAAELPVLLPAVQLSAT